jgi:hypothetical protein
VCDCVCVCVCVCVRVCDWMLEEATVLLTDLTCYRLD